MYEFVRKLCFFACSPFFPSTYGVCFSGLYSPCRYSITYSSPHYVLVHTISSIFPVIFRCFFFPLIFFRYIITYPSHLNLAPEIHSLRAFIHFLAFPAFEITYFMYYVFVNTDHWSHSWPLGFDCFVSLLLMLYFRILSSTRTTDVLRTNTAVYVWKTAFCSYLLLRNSYLLFLILL